MPDKLTETLTVAEIAGALKLSRQTVTRMFEKEPGVISLDRPERMHKQGYRTLRIPRHVYERVILRFTKR